MSLGLKKHKQKLKQNRNKIGATILAITLAAALLTTTLTQQETTGETEFNRADIMFMNMMIVHHDQAIEMADLAENRTNNTKILNLSKDIFEAQTSENQQMNEWMQQLGYNPGNHHKMAGMATEEEMNQLKNSKGTEFNQLFAELMIEHHEGGIAMAQNFKQSGQNQQLKEMQLQMIDAQKEEIDKMQKWQREDQL